MYQNTTGGDNTAVGQGGKITVKLASEIQH